jgi:hypothetical protein
VRSDGENMTRGESVQPLHIVKLVYQSCSRSRAVWISSGLDGSSSVGASLGNGMVGSVGSFVWNPSVGMVL